VTLMLAPYIPNIREIHESDIWIKDNCYRYYAIQRRDNCTFTQRMNLWLRAPYCEVCILSHPSYKQELPDITPSNWEYDIAWELGEDTLNQVKIELAADPDFSFLCKKCQRNLAPWHGNAIYIIIYNLEEHYNIPLYTPGKMSPSKKIRDKIFKLYGNVCFACGESGPDLHIDHIYPQSRGGDSAFRNLQPLCKFCGQKKGDTLPEDVDVWSNTYFRHQPSESYESLFW
jgi:hypothetical protein